MNFCYYQVWNFKISNLYEQNQNFGVIFWKYWKWKQKSTKNFETSQKPSVIPLNYCKMSLVSWNLIIFCKILEFLIELCKNMKDLRKILLKWLGKTVKYCLNFINFCCTEKCPKVANFQSFTLTKKYGIPPKLSPSQPFSFNKISSRFISFMTEIFCFMKTSRYLLEISSCPE